MSERASSSDPADILLVEDNPGDVRLTKEAFEDGRIANTLHVVNDGVEALDFLYRRGDHADAPCPDIVLLDLNLPRKDGDEVLEEINSDPELSRVPVVVLTSSEAQEDIVRSYELDANAYLTKPVDPNKFIDTVKTLQTFWLSVIRLPPYADENELSPSTGENE
ncbi:response regulator [Halostella sp. PRR32]|uniref:response regulator n=1 Tax=Halostella sp. PRR32 TaxID=3098147 RepID=UPI002B1DEB2E|nr:response regulator [Halostella sp. PRR32]